LLKTHPYFEEPLHSSVLKNSEAPASVTPLYIRPGCSSSSKLKALLLILLFQPQTL